MFNEIDVYLPEKKMLQMIPHNQSNIMLAEVSITGLRPSGRWDSGKKNIVIRHDVILGWTLPKDSENWRAVTSSRPEPHRIDSALSRIEHGDTIKVLDAHNTQHKIQLTGIDACSPKSEF